MFNTAFVSAGIGVIKQSSTKDQAKPYKFDIATGQSSCSSLSRKTDTAHNKIHYNGGLFVASLRESTRKKYKLY